jgi:hypothetical protein
MNLKSNVLNERSQTQKVTCYMIQSTNARKGKTTVTENPGDGRGRDMEMQTGGVQVTF